MSRKKPFPRSGDCECRFLAETGAETQNLVWALRHWLDGVYGQNLVWRHISSNLGSVDGHRTMRDFESFLAAVASSTHRPLRRGPSCCPRIHEDEASLGAILHFAGAGDRRSATALAELLVCAGVEEIVTLAAELGPVFALLPPPSDAAGASAPVAGKMATHSARPTMH